MGTRLVNVRLDEKRLQKARQLRASGIPLSEVVRDAIDQRYDRLLKSSRPRDVESIMKQIYEDFPDPPDLPARGYDVHDRVAARRAILRKLRSTRT
jgi:hypothetical protein